MGQNVPVRQYIFDRGAVIPHLSKWSASNLATYETLRNEYTPTRSEVLNIMKEEIERI
jgi:hypothetical protein